MSDDKTKNDKASAPLSNTPELQPDVVTMPETPAPEGEKNDTKQDESKKEGPKAAEGPKDPKKEKKGIDSSGKDPRQQLVDELSQMVEDLNDSVNSTLKKGLKKLGDKFAETELGQSLTKLKDELAEAKARLGEKISDKWDEVTKPVTDKLNVVKDKLSAIGNAIDQLAAAGVNKVTEKVSGTKKEEKQEEEIKMTPPENTDVKASSKAEKIIEGIEMENLSKKKGEDKQQPELGDDYTSAPKNTNN